MEKSNNIAALSKALFVFHKEMGKIAKTSTNPFFKSKYADLPTILDAIAAPLENAGLVIVSIPDSEGLTSLIIHAESGEYISANAIMKPVKSDPQSMGSAITYQRRYSIGSILNLNIDIDDDGNKASAKGETKQAERQAEKHVEAPTVKLTPKMPAYTEAVAWIAKSDLDPKTLIAQIRGKYIVDYNCEKELLEDVETYIKNQ